VLSTLSEADDVGGRAPFRGIASDAAARAALQTSPPCRFERVRHAGSGTQVVLDVGHNPPALRCLVARLRAEFAPGTAFRFVAGFSADKDLAVACALLLECAGGDVARVHFAAARHPRAVPAAALDAVLAGLGQGGEGADGGGGAAAGGAPSSLGLSQAERLAQLTAEAAGAAASRRVDDAGEDGAPDDYTSVVAEGEGGVGGAVAAALAAAATAEAPEVVVVCGTVFMMADARAALGFDEPRDSDALLTVAGAHLKGAAGAAGAEKRAREAAAAAAGGATA
jgi:dihydrofolate synthase/folylpolyglutamate synthase